MCTSLRNVYILFCHANTHAHGLHSACNMDTMHVCMGSSCVHMNTHVYEHALTQVHHGLVCRSAFCSDGVHTLHAHCMSAFCVGGMAVFTRAHICVECAWTAGCDHMCAWVNKRLPVHSGYWFACAGLQYSAPGESRVSGPAVSQFIAGTRNSNQSVLPAEFSSPSN